MLLPRIIPCLLVKNKGLVKSVQFKNHKYVGDPINAVRIFNEKGVDELIVIDIDATAEDREPDYQMIERLAVECRMPLCYGGGIKNIAQAEKIFSLGVEKIAISSAAINNPLFVMEIAERVGSQSVVVVFDVKKRIFGGYDIYINNGQKKINMDLVALLEEVQERGVGEIVINSIDRDGSMKGYDLDLVKYCSRVIKVPLTVLGGAGDLSDFGNLIREFGTIGVAAGSLFVFKGKYKAVLINYPTDAEKNALFQP